MVIKGILDNSLNGQLCIRGFANIKELARLSEADYSYQRRLIDRTDIGDFLEHQSYLFFPEVILSYKIKYKLDLRLGEPLKLIQEGRKYKSNVSGDSTEILVKIINYQTMGESPIKVVRLSIDDKDGKPFHRIDGNHRLEAAEKSSSDKVGRMVIPFCLLLGTEYYDRNEHLVENEETKEFDKAVKVFFHNINTKTIPLTSEENLKVILDDSVVFPNSELSKIFGSDYPVYSRLLMQEVKPHLFQGIEHILEKNSRSFYNEVFQRYLSNGYDKHIAVKSVIRSLQAVNQLYVETPILGASFSVDLLLAFVWYYIKGTDAFIAFKNWILSNRLFVLSDVKADSFIEVFDKIHSNRIDIFVAMPYFQGNAEIIEEYNNIYSEVVAAIKEETKINLSLFPIMCNKGETGDQIQDIINKIKESKIVIADISDNNANVLYEMGWARALEKRVIIVKRKGSPPAKSDIQNDTWHEYDDSCRTLSLKKVARENILEVLKTNFGLISE